MTNENGLYLEEEIKRLGEENKALNVEIYKIAKKLHRHMVWDQVMSIIKVLLIVIPLIYGYIILAPQLKTAFDTYKSLLGGGDGLPSTQQNYQLNQSMLQNLPPETIQQLLKAGIIK